MKKIPRSWLERHRSLAEHEVPLAGTGHLTEFETRVAAAANTVGEPTPAHALALVVKAVCDREGLSVKELATRLALSDDEVASILDARSQPSMRLVSSVSRGLQLSTAKVAAIAGLGSVRNASNDAVMVRYATLSKGMRSLDGDAQELIAEFIEFMSEE